MATNLSTILNILAKPPGDLVFHLVVGLALIITGGYAIIKLGKTKEGSQQRSFLIGCGILILLQLGLFGFRANNTGTTFVAVNFFQFYERMTATLTILWLIWAFFDDEERILTTDLNLLLSFALIVLAVASVFVRPRVMYMDMFNPLLLDVIWQTIALVLITLGLLLAFFTKPLEYKTLVAILTVLGVGHFIQILLVAFTNWQMGAVRLAQMITMPALYTVVKPLSGKVRQAQQRKATIKPFIAQAKAKSMAKKQTKAQSKTQAITQAKGQATTEVKAQAKSKAKTRNKAKVKFNPITRLQQLIKGPTTTSDSSTSDRIDYLKQRLQPKPRNTHIPNPPEPSPAGGNIEMTADTKPALVNSLLEISLSPTRDERYQAIVRALSLSVVSDICYLIEISESQDKLHVLTGYDLIREVPLKPDTLTTTDLPLIMDAWRAYQPIELSQNGSKVRDMRTLASLLNHHTAGNLFAYPLGLPDEPLAGGVIFLSPYTSKPWGEKIRQLMDEIHGTLTNVLYLPTHDEQRLQKENQKQLSIFTLEEEIERLRQGLADKDARIHENEITIKGLKAKYQIEKMEAISNLERMKSKIAELTAQVAHPGQHNAQKEQLLNEIRLLTDEREQLRLALSRANSMIAELRTESGQTGPIRLSLESQIISLDSIAANVRLRVATQIQQKNLVLEIHNPDGRQMIRTDPELLQTALHELLVNAIRASEAGGTVKLNQKLSLEMGMLIIQVTDFGEGLTQAEQADLFSAQHEDIPGIGDVQAIRNAIRAIRVLNGKIWLKSEKAAFTTFRFQIPVRIID